MYHITENNHVSNKQCKYSGISITQIAEEMEKLQVIEYFKIFRFKLSRAGFVKFNKF